MPLSDYLEPHYDDNDTTCAECGEGERLREDPREPPIECGECLCLECYVSAAEERLDEITSEADELRKEIKSCQKTLKAKNKRKDSH